MELVCPKCGRRADESELIESFCPSCYPAKIKCPSKLSLKQCKKCGRIFLRGQWVREDDEALSSWVVSKCRGEFEEGEYAFGKARFLIKKQGGNVYVECFISMEYLPTTCERCSKISGGYYEAVVQLRGDPVKIAKFLKHFKRAIAKKTFISKEEERHGGVDVYVGSSKAVLEFISENRLNAKITSKLVGMKDGKRVYRATVLLRF